MSDHRPRARRGRFIRPPEANFVDRMVWIKLERLGIPAGELAGDAVFVRRVYLDTIGTLPTAQEARQFLADADAHKRQKLVDRLLAREEYADYWTMFWSDLLRVDRDRLTPPGAVAVTRWLRKRFADNTPYDAFVREIITARGDMRAEGPAALYEVFDSPEEAGRSLSQLFLGVRIESRPVPSSSDGALGPGRLFRLGRLLDRRKAQIGAGRPRGPHRPARHGSAKPATGRVSAHALGGAASRFHERGRPGQVVSNWMTAPENPFFARAIANRLWAHYFGRGLVEPVDDLRATNPAVNEPLLMELANHLRVTHYDLKVFTRTLLMSRVYQLGPQTNAGNARDDQNFSHAAFRPLPAEVLLDAICQATGVPEKFNGWPEGYRAIHVWDNRMPSYFFRIFGRPVRAAFASANEAPSQAPRAGASSHELAGDLEQDPGPTGDGTPARGLGPIGRADH